VEARWLTGGDGGLLREVRLQALADAPFAFDSRLAVEVELPGGFWDARTAESEAGESGRVFVAFEETTVLGRAGGFVRESDRGTAILWGMWVSPHARRRGVASALVEAVADWARAQAAHTLELIVTDAAAPNPPALLYQRLGFIATGEQRRFEFNPSLTGLVMTLAL
jgi:GNAT superfamily N-acetyltransferase